MHKLTHHSYVAEHLHTLTELNGLSVHAHFCQATGMSVTVQRCALDTAVVLAGESIEAGDSIRNKFLQAVYEQIPQNLDSGSVAQGSISWNLYSVGVGCAEPYQITMADTSTMAVLAAQVRACLQGFLHCHLPCNLTALQRHSNSRTYFDLITPVLLSSK